MDKFISLEGCRDKDGDMDTERMLAAGCDILYAYWIIEEEDGELEFDIVIHETKDGPKYYYGPTGVSWVDGPFSSFKEAKAHSQSTQKWIFLP